MSQNETKEVPDMLEMFAGIATGVGSAIGGPIGIAGHLVHGLLSATAQAIRARGESVEDIIARIKAPPELDTSFRDDIDRQIANKPSGR